MRLVLDRKDASILASGLFVLIVLPFAGCKKKEAPAGPALPSKTQAESGIPARCRNLASPKLLDACLRLESMRPAYEREKPFIEAQKAKDRAELVRPAPAGFKPSKSKKRIKIALIPKTTTLKVGDSFWYRIEFQNIGPDPIHIMELGWSFFKRGKALSDWEFDVTLPNGKTEWMAPPHDYGCGPQEITALRGVPREKGLEAMRNMEFLEKLERELELTLDPGEILVTRPWRFNDYPERCEMEKRGQDPDARIPGDFREYPNLNDFKKPGIYHVKAVWTRGRIFVIHPKPPPDDFVRETIGNVESNAVRLEVVP